MTKFDKDQAVKVIDDYVYWFGHKGLVSHQDSRTKRWAVLFRGEPNLKYFEADQLEPVSESEASAVAADVLSHEVGDVEQPNSSTGFDPQKAREDEIVEALRSAQSVMRRAGLIGYDAPIDATAAVEIAKLLLNTN